MNKIQLINKGTGEVIPFERITKKHIDEYFMQMDDKQKADFITEAAFHRKLADKLENLAKKHVSANHEFVFDDDNEARFEQWLLKRSYRNNFDEELFLKEATEPEKKIYEAWKKISKKYTSPKEIITWK